MQRHSNRVGGRGHAHTGCCWKNIYVKFSKFENLPALKNEKNYKNMVLCHCMFTKL